jgi:hypothetical protein
VEQETEPHIKITMQMMYVEQQQTNRMLATAVGHLENLADLPERVRNLETENAEHRTEIKNLKRANQTAISALIAAGVGLLVQAVNWFTGN